MVLLYYSKITTNLFYLSGLDILKEVFELHGGVYPLPPHISWMKIVNQEPLLPCPKSGELYPSNPSNAHLVGKLCLLCLARFTK